MSGLYTPIQLIANGPLTGQTTGATNSAGVGRELAYSDRGSGLPIVFLHAFPLNRTMWAQQEVAERKPVR